MFARSCVRQEFLIVDDPHPRRRFPDVATCGDVSPIVRLVDGDVR